MAVTISPKNLTHELRRTVYQAERFYTKDLTEPVTFGTRPLWRVSIDWGMQHPNIADMIVAQIADVAAKTSTWNLYLSSVYPDKTEILPTTDVSTLVSSFTSDKITLKNPSTLSQVDPGEVFQVNMIANQIERSWVLRVTKKTEKSIGDELFYELFVENMPKSLASMVYPFPSTMNVSYSTKSLTIQARVEGGNPPAVERLERDLSRVLPVIISEVA